jgi:hypothetical protein
LKAHLSRQVKSGDAIDIPGHRMQLIFTNLQSAEAPHTPGASNELSTEPKTAWTRPLVAVLRFFDGLEIMLMVLATLTFALIFFYFNR